MLCRPYERVAQESEEEAEGGEGASPAPPAVTAHVSAVPAGWADFGGGAPASAAQAGAAAAPRSEGLIGGRVHQLREANKSGRDTDLQASAAAAQAGGQGVPCQASFPEGDGGLAPWSAAPL